MCHVQVLVLQNNEIADAGLTALVKAVESGALPKCTAIALAGNPASAEAKQAVQDAIASRA